MEENTSIGLVTDKKSHKFYPLDSDSCLFPGFEGFHALWARKKGDRFLPSWTDFEFEDFEPWWGRLCVVDISYDPFDYCFRLWSTQCVEVYQNDYTGKCFSTLIKDGLVPESDRTYYEKLATNELIGTNYDILEWQDRGHIAPFFLDLPLSDDGRTISMYLSTMLTKDHTDFNRAMNHP